jgi:Type II restriction endonuclease EcoO109I
LTSEETDLLSDLLDPIPRVAVVPAVRAALGVTHSEADRIVQAFDDFVARPLEANLAKMRGRDLAKRNPLVYTVRGTESVEDWAGQVLADKETSAIEGHIGTFLEEVARIVSGGIKPGSGVDLQLTDADGVVYLYAIQSAPNTKNSGGRRTDVEALKRAARPLRAHRQHVEMRIAVLSGRPTSRPMRSEPDVLVVGSDAFWGEITGIADFRARLLRASTMLSWLVRRRSADETARIKAEAVALFGDADGKLNLDALANATTA